MRMTVVATIALAMVLSAGPASAYFQSRGTGAAATTVASVPLAASVTATQTSEGTVSVSWTAPATSLPVVQKVRRITKGVSTIVCTTTASTCDDTAVPPGAVAYDVITSYRTWSTTSTPSASITVIDHVPTITSFVRTSPAATNLGVVAWRVVLSEPVTGPGPTNFTLAASGITGAAITSVTGSGTVWTLSASTGSGSGTITPTFASSAGVTDSTGNAVTTPVTGESYAVRPFFPTALTLVNGGSNNRIDTGDTIVLTFSTTISPSSLCGAWTVPGDHAAAAATVTLLDGGTGNDSLSFALTTCPVLHLGSITLGSTGYIAGGSSTFAASIASTVATNAITVTLGTRSGTGTIATVGSSPTATFVPDPLLTSAADTSATGSITSTGRF